VYQLEYEKLQILLHSISREKLLSNSVSLPPDKKFCPFQELPYCLEHLPLAFLVLSLKF